MICTGHTHFAFTQQHQQQEKRAKQTGATASKLETRHGRNGLKWAPLLNLALQFHCDTTQHPLRVQPFSAHASGVTGHVSHLPECTLSLSPGSMQLEQIAGNSYRGSCTALLAPAFKMKRGGVEVWEGVTNR